MVSYCPNYIQNIFGHIPSSFRDVRELFITQEESDPGYDARELDNKTLSYILYFPIE